ISSYQGLAETQLEWSLSLGYRTEMFYDEPLPPFNKVVVISDEEIDTTFDF
ncbi:MAG: hypothetical protein HKO68_20595, partial [Desulfobacterales bacterium]|nr:hypothetical protein [Desulfobacterales bacterium]